MIRVVLLISIVPFAFGALGGMVGRTQSVGATGILLCNGQPAADVLVKMYDDDRGTTICSLLISNLKNASRIASF